MIKSSEIFVDLSDYLGQSIPDSSGYPNREELARTLNMNPGLKIKGVSVHVGEKLQPRANYPLEGKK